MYPGKLCNSSTCDSRHNVSQMLWPDHCVINTPDAKLSSRLDVKPADVVVQKGYNCEVFFNPSKPTNVILQKLQSFVLNIHFETKWSLPCRIVWWYLRYSSAHTFVAILFMFVFIRPEVGFVIQILISHKVWISRSIWLHAMVGLVLNCNS